MVNLEVEAYIAQYQYTKKLSDYTPGSKWKRFYEETKRGKQISSLSDYYLTKNGTLRNQNMEDDFNTLFSEIGRTIADMRNSKGGETVSLDKSRSAAQNLKNLSVLVKGC